MEHKIEFNFSTVNIVEVVKQVHLLVHANNTRMSVIWMCSKTPCTSIGQVFESPLWLERHHTTVEVFVPQGFEPLG